MTLHLTDCVPVAGPSGYVAADLKAQLNLAAHRLELLADNERREHFKALMVEWAADTRRNLARTIGEPA